MYKHVLYLFVLLSAVILKLQEKKYKQSLLNQQFDESTVLVF